MRWHLPKPKRHVVRPEPGRGFTVALLYGASILTIALVAFSALTGASLSPWTWYLTRASGLVLYALIWLATVLGLGLTTTLLDRFGGRAVLFSVHAYATELAYGFLALHLLTLAADQTVPFGFMDLLVPFSSPWLEPWTGFGVLAGALLVLVGASFSVRWLIGYRGWRLLHWLTFPLYGLALAIALVATPLVKELALRIGAVDVPNERKVHHGVMPRLGGLAIYLSFVVGFLLFVPKTTIAWGIFLGGSVIALVGALDDRYQLSPKAKLLGQLVAAFVAHGYACVRDDALVHRASGHRT